MFVKAIEEVSKFTRPIHTISKTYNGKHVIPGAGTLFFVNEEGYAITCKHMVEVITKASLINKKYQDFKTERDKLDMDRAFKTNLQQIETRYKYKNDTIIQQKNSFIDCVDKMSGYTVSKHPDFDLAILKFNDFSTIKYSGHAIFPKETSGIKQGKFLCRLGFPFPEFSNFLFDEKKEELVWTNTGLSRSPIFPLEGMITRFVMGKGVKMGIELSTPGLRGQSGAPLFDDQGIIYGMQSRTKHLHLGFDIENLEIRSKGKLKKVDDYSFLHLGECIHVDVIKNFLKEKKVKFYEQPDEGFNGFSSSDNQDIA